jgi:nucleotide-binding universal stress UspA family protein
MKMSDDDVDVDEIPLRKILVPLDGSEWSFRAAKYAIKIAKMANAQIVCVHAVVSLPTTAYANVHAGILIPRYIEEAKKEVQKWYDEVRIIAEKSGVVRLSTETFLDVSSAADAIISYAEGNNIDLIIMGTKGRTGLKKIVLGSVASGVICMPNVLSSLSGKNSTHIMQILVLYDNTSHQTRSWIMH